MKTCSVCKIKKDKISYHKDNRSKDGLHHRCRKCKTAQDKIRNQKYLRTDKGYILHILNSHKCSDKLRGYDTSGNMTVEEVMDLYRFQKQTCFYSGKPLKFGSHIPKNQRASLDRIDNSKPHTRDNIIICSLSHNIKRNSKTCSDYLLQISMD